MKSAKKKPKKMTSSIYQEVNKFTKYLQHIKYLLKETKKAYKSIEGDVHVVQKSDIPVKFPEDCEGELKTIISTPLSIVVFGQSRYAKATVVNEIFRKNVVPMEIKNPNSAWRMVRFKYGLKPHIALMLPDDNYDLGDNLSCHEKPWECIPEEDLELDNSERYDSANQSAILEVTLNHSLLKEGANLLISPSCYRDDEKEIAAMFNQCCNGVLPILVYALDKDKLTVENKKELAIFHELAGENPFFFIRVPDLNGYQSFCNQRNMLSNSMRLSSPSSHSIKPSFLSMVDLPIANNHNNAPIIPAGETSADYPPTFSSDIPPNQTSIDSPNPLSNTASPIADFKLFSELCSMGFLSSMPRDYPSLKNLASFDNNIKLHIDSELVVDFEKGFNKILLFVRSCVQRCLIRAASLLYRAHAACLHGFILQAYGLAYDIMITPKRLEFARSQESKLFSALYGKTQDKQAEIAHMIADTLVSLRESVPEAAAEYVIVGVNPGKPLTSREYKICTGQIREFVLQKVNSAIAAHLLESIDVLRETYLGTLERCLTSLETNPDDTTSTTEALKGILNSTYRIAVPFKTSSSFIRNLLEKMKELLHTLPWQPGPLLDSVWKRRVATDMLNSLSEIKIAKEVCGQISDKLKQSHDSFLQAMRRLESRIEVKTIRSEEAQDRIRRVHAPRIARLSLESISIRDSVLYGIPSLGRELGRGQYGVVYACSEWGPYSPIAIKSVVPPDDKHWNDLALEFYYTRQLPEHDRLVTLKGSVIDYAYGGGSTPAVLLIMEKMTRDLYLAIKQGLDFVQRLQVAADVIEGIRFLHSQGLIHRDIKLKNVLLDSRNRGKLTDLGFCKPHAMMSGSVVGTPIHMAPELFSGRYDSSVDVYAFGILFWYVCAGKVRLPFNFEQCSNKDMLWTAVKKGVRPERLPHFDTECWELMQNCWHPDPQKRPFPGTIDPILKTIQDRTKVIDSLYLAAQKSTGIQNAMENGDD